MASSSLSIAFFAILSAFALSFFLCLFRNVISKLNPYSFVNPTHLTLTYPPKMANHAYIVAGVELFCQYHRRFCQSLCFTEKEMRWLLSLLLNFRCQRNNRDRRRIIIANIILRPEHRDWRDINHLADKPSFLSFAVVSNLHTLIWIKPARYHAETAPGSAF